jgi:hypothetical protein
MLVMLLLAAVIVGGRVEAQYEYVNPYLKTYKYEIQPIQPYTFTNPYTNPRRNSSSTETSSYSWSNPATVVSPKGEYLGNTSANKYDPDSINNPYGRYGSRFSSESVNNPYGQYGSRFSSESANNPYATDAPHLYGSNGREDRGHLSANQYDPDSVENRYSPKYDQPLATQRQLLRLQIIESYSRDPAAFLQSYRKLSQESQATILDLLEE